MQKTVFKQIIHVHHLVGERRIYLNFWTMTTIVGALIIAGVYSDQYFHHQLSGLDAAIEKLKAQEPILRDELKKKKLELSKGKQLIAIYPETKKFEEAKPSFSYELELLMKNHVENVWLTHISFNRQTHEAKLIGYALDPTLINQYFDKIQESKELAVYHLDDLVVGGGNILSEENREKKTAPAQKETKSGKKSPDVSSELDGVATYRFTISTKQAGE